MEKFTLFFKSTMQWIKNNWRLAIPYLEFILIGVFFWFIPQYKEWEWIKVGQATTLATVMIFAIASLGFSALMGNAGLISLGTAGFMGLGAYGIAYLTNVLNWSFEVSFLVSLFIPLIIGLLVGLVSLRIEGMYLAIATLGVSEILRKSFIELADITRGPSGFVITKYMTVFGVQLDRWTTIRMIAVVLVISMILMHTLSKSFVGRAMLTMRSSEPAAQAMGIHLVKYKLIAFTIATLYAAVAGVLYMSIIRFTAPTDWDILVSLNVLAIIIIGGARSIKGIIVGSFVVYGFPSIVLNQIPGFKDIPGLPYIFSGVTLVLVLIFYPGGIAQLGLTLQNLVRKGWKAFVRVVKGGLSHGK